MLRKHRAPAAGAGDRGDDEKDVNKSAVPQTAAEQSSIYSSVAVPQKSETFFLN